MISQNIKDCFYTKYYEEKRSKFYAYLFKVEDEEEVKKKLLECQSEHPKARHFLKVGRIKNNYGIYNSFFSEDREPISSMKKTAFNMDKDKLEDILIIIVRYYGGTNLGASNLDRVYFTLAMNLVSYFKANSH